MRITLGYSAKLILPYQEALVMISLLKSAEIEDYSTALGTVIMPIDAGTNNLEYTPISNTRYIKMKAAHLLKIHVDKLNDLELTDEIELKPESAESTG